MAYSNFTLQKFCSKFGFSLETGTVLFAENLTLSPSQTLIEALVESQKIPLLSEKAKSEAIIFPVLQEINRHNNYEIGLFSGANLNADVNQELAGECDFILSVNSQKFLIQNPIFALVNAKKDDIDDHSLGQCTAQMYGARLMNQQQASGTEIIYGCVTTGEIWQFMKLENQTVWIDEKRYYIDRVERILGVLQWIVDQYK